MQVAGLQLNSPCFPLVNSILVTLVLILKVTCLAPGKFCLPGGNTLLCLFCFIFYVTEYFVSFLKIYFFVSNNYYLCLNTSMLVPC